MFLLPLGLQSRIVKWPIATVLLIVATCIVSVFYFSENALYIRHVRQSMMDSKILEARKNLIIASCTGRFEAESCDYVKAHLQTVDLFDLQNFFKDYRKQFPNASFFENRKLLAWLDDDRLDRKLKSTGATNLPEYDAYLVARETYLQKSLQASKEDHIFIRGNATLVAGLKAMFTHQGWVHLIGNMVIFALFAAFVEQRIGLLGMVVLYMLGGLGSNFLQLPFLPMGVRLFGASGAVSAVIGAFAVYFWREKMRCLLNVGFVFNRMITMPSWMYIGVFMVFSDVVGAMGAGGGVAHMAHLTGFLIGFIFAFMQMDLFPLKKSFLFAQEEALYYEAKEIEILDEKMAIFRRIYALNRESFYAFRGLFVYFHKQGLLLSTFNKEDLDFVKEILHTCFHYSDHKNEKYVLSREILGLVPLMWNIVELELKVTPEEIIERAEEFYGVGDLIQTLRYYDLFFTSFAAHPRAQDLQAHIMRIFDDIEKFDHDIKIQILDTLLAYLDHHPDTHFQTQIRQLIHQIHREEKNAAS
jgi:membrane associated rhomboid family serine protease